MLQQQLIVLAFPFVFVCLFCFYLPTFVYSYSSGMIYLSTLTVKVFGSTVLKCIDKAIYSRYRDYTDEETRLSKKEE